MSKRLNELRRAYDEAVKAMRDIHETAEKESRGLSADELVQWNNANSGLEELRARIQREEVLAAEELRTGKPVDPSAEGTLRDPVAQRALHGDRARNDEPTAVAFRSYLQHGPQALTDEQRHLLAERRDLSLTGASGGFTVPQGFYGSLVAAQRLWGGFIDPNTVTLYETAMGNNVPVPLEDDTGNAATIVAEGSSTTTSTDATFASVTLGASMYRSLVRVSLELMQDSAFNLEQYLTDRLAIRLWRGYNGHASTGTGSSQPQGLFNATVGATIGHTAATGNTTNFPYISLVALEHSVDPIYRASPKCKWMFSDGVLQALKQQLDTTNRPIWMPNYAAQSTSDTTTYTAFPGTILGYQYVVNPDAPAMAASARSVAFGDFSYYITRRVMAMTILRASERFIDSGQIGFYLFARMDGRFANPTATAARSPIRLGQNSAT